MTPSGSFPALINWHVGCQRLTPINLSRTVNASTFGFTDLTIICNPTRHSSDSKHYREHFQWDPDGAQDNTTVEINIWIELSFDEIRLLQGRLLELQSDIQQWIAPIQRFEQLVALFFYDLCAWVVVLVNAMAETHEPAPALFVLGGLHETRPVIAFLANLFEHLNHGLVCAAM